MFEGKAKTMSGVMVDGDKLTIELVKAGPDLLARLAMPFFQAINPALSADHNPNGVDTPASCGPYYIADRIPNNSITLMRNRYYTGPRPHNLSEIDYKIGNTPVVIEQNIESGTADYAASGVAPPNYKSIADKYGVNKERFWVEPQLSVQYLAMNTSRPLLRTTSSCGGRQLGDLTRGPARAGRLLRGGADRPDPAAGDARLQAGERVPAPADQAGCRQGPGARQGQHAWRQGDPLDLHHPAGPAPGRDLSAEPQGDRARRPGEQFTRAVQIQKEGIKGAEFDFTTEGWAADYADPSDFINVLLDGTNIKAANNSNVAYFDDPAYNKRMANASLLFGDQRYTTYAGLDADLRGTPPLGGPRRLHGPDLPLRKQRLLHVQRGLRGRPRGALSQVGFGQEGALMPSRSEGVLYKSPLHETVSTTGDRLLERLLLDRGADRTRSSNGAVGATSNPTIVGEVLQEGDAPLARPDRRARRRQRDRDRGRDRLAC